MRIRRIIILAPVISFFALGINFIAGCALKLDACENEELQTISTPEGQRKAIIFQRDCGATTGFNTQISILQANEGLPNEGGNTFIADTDHGQAASGPKGPELNVQWQNDAELIVKYDKRMRIYRCEQMVRGVRIKYEPR